MRVLLLLLSCLLPVSALAAGPPLDTPANPLVPLGPVEPGSPPDAPPLVLDLPGPPDTPGRPELRVGSAPDSLPVPEDLPGIPELVNEVALPDGAREIVTGLAPPFGGTPGGSSGHSAPVPEPASALLLALGLGGVALARRR